MSLIPNMQHVHHYMMNTNGSKGVHAHLVCCCTLVWVLHSVQRLKPTHTARLRTRLPSSTREPESARSGLGLAGTPSATQAPLHPEPSTYSSRGCAATQACHRSTRTRHLQQMTTAVWYCCCEGVLQQQQNALSPAPLSSVKCALICRIQTAAIYSSHEQQR